MTELEHLVETATHGLKAIQLLAEKYPDKVQVRVRGGAWQAPTSEIGTIGATEIRVKDGN